MAAQASARQSVFRCIQFNPLNYNPLRSVLAEVVDVDRVRRERPVKLFCFATNVRTGKARVFTNGDISVATVLASARPYRYRRCSQ
jgi:NTE family protein